MKFLVFILGILMLVNCVGFKSPLFYNTSLKDNAPQGTPIFRLGWKDGCQTAFHTSGGMHYRVVNKFEFKANFIENDEYNEGWHMAFNHCRFYITSWQRRAI